MKLLTTLRRGAVAAVIVTGLALFGSALQGVASIDTSLRVAASRATPERTLVQETRSVHDCPDRTRRPAHRDRRDV